MALSFNNQDVKQAARRLLFLELALAVILLLSAGTLVWAMAWAFLVTCTLCLVLLSLDVLFNMPALFARRLNAGPAAELRPEQKHIQAFNSVVFLALIVVPGLDHRFGWSDLGTGWIIAGHALLIAGFLFIDLVFRTNEFAGSTVGTAMGQTVIEGGPYAFVRHPMYSGTLLIALGIALALASARACLLVIPVVAGLAWRLIDEEQMLRQDLPGYEAYAAKVRARLIPFVW